MLNDTQVCIVIGASHAGAQLAQAVRREGWTGRIILIGDEPVAPYHRPPLSKALLMGDKSADELFLMKMAAYDNAQIELKLAEKVVSIDRTEKQISLESGEKLNYTKLALCTGARVRKLAIPGNDLKGIHYLRTLADAQAIQQEVTVGKKAVIVGGGYIGLETAASLRKLGMEVTVLEMMSRVLERVTAAELSEYYTSLHLSHGVKIICNAQALEFKGHDRVEKVVCNNDLTLDADMVIVGIGVIPNIELAEAAGLKTSNGILVDEFACTNDPDIVAAGDCTFHPNEMLGTSLRLESVPNATEQAKTAAASICGMQKAYSALPWFWSDQYNIKLQIAGLNRGYERVIIQGDPSTHHFVAWYIAGNHVIAADCVNRPKEFMQAKKIVSQKLPVEESELISPLV